MKLLIALVIFLSLSSSATAFSQRANYKSEFKSQSFFGLGFDYSFADYMGPGFTLHGGVLNKNRTLIGGTYFLSLGRAATRVDNFSIKENSWGVVVFGGFDTTIAPSLFLRSSVGAGAIVLQKTITQELSSGIDGNPSSYVTTSPGAILIPRIELFYKIAPQVHIGLGFHYSISLIFPPGQDSQFLEHPGLSFSALYLL